MQQSPGLVHRRIGYFLRGWSVSATYIYLSFLGLRMINFLRHEGHLFLPFFAHFCIWLLFVFCCYIERLYNFYILQQDKRYQYKMRFFILYK